MDLRNLKTFISVAELASFTRAAEQLGFSQSTVSFQIKQLERELGIRLFERTRHAMKLTDQGREVLRYAYRMDKLTQDLAEDLHAKEEITGHVRLATADSLCSCLGRAFRGFWSLYPGISLKIVTAGTASLFQLLRHNEVDLVLTLDSHIHNSEYRLIRESQIGTHFVASPDCALCKKSYLSVEELLNYPFLLTEKGMSYRRLMDESLAARSLEIQPLLETSDTELLCQLVSQGAGCSFLPDYATDAAVADGRLVRLPVADFEVKVWKQLFCHRDKWISPQLQAVMDYCADF